MILPRILVLAALVGALVPVMPSQAATCHYSFPPTDDVEPGDGKYDPGCCKNVLTVPIIVDGDKYYLNVRRAAEVDPTIPSLVDPHVYPSNPTRSVHVSNAPVPDTSKPPQPMVEKWMDDYAAVKPVYEPEAAFGAGMLVWLYQESNGVPDLQRGGYAEYGMRFDGCYDRLPTLAADVHLV